MDITPQDNTQPISDDQELAKALAGVLPEDDSTTDANSPTGLHFEETAAPAAPAAPAAIVPPAPAPVAPVAEVPSFTMPSLDTPAASDSSDLDGVKLEALKELRPLSTDDKTLIAPAHTAAQGIADEKRKAEALLEIIKEIDYLSRKDQPAA